MPGLLLLADLGYGLTSQFLQVFRRRGSGRRRQSEVINQRYYPMPSESALMIGLISPSPPVPGVLLKSRFRSGRWIFGVVGPEASHADENGCIHSIPAQQRLDFRRAQLGQLKIALRVTLGAGVAFDGEGRRAEIL